MESTRSPWYSDIFFWQVTITFKKTWKKSHGISRQSPLIPIKIPYLIAMNPIYNPIFWFIETQKSPPGTWPAGHGCLPELHRAHFAGCPGRSCKWQRGGRISWHFSGINHGIFVAYIYILVGGLEPWNFMTFHSVGNVIIPTDEVHHFSEGLAQPPTSIDNWY